VVLDALWGEMPVEVAAPNSLSGRRDAPRVGLALSSFLAVFQAQSVEILANQRLSPREKVTLHNPDDGLRLGKPLEASYGAFSFQCVQSSW
jgi:hypothetical protein